MDWKGTALVFHSSTMEFIISLGNFPPIFWQGAHVFLFLHGIYRQFILVSVARGNVVQQKYVYGMGEQSLPPEYHGVWLFIYGLIVCEEIWINKHLADGYIITIIRLSSGYCVVLLIIKYIWPCLSIYALSVRLLTQASSTSQNTDFCGQLSTDFIHNLGAYFVVTICSPHLQPWRTWVNLLNLKLLWWNHNKRILNVRKYTTYLLKYAIFYAISASFLIHVIFRVLHL